MKILSYMFILFCSVTTFSEVKPPNFNFKFDELNNFMPGSLKKTIEQKYQNGKLTKLSKKVSAYRYEIKNQRYKFPIYVQYKDDKVTDFYVSLPSYFSHDIFHASIIKRFGKQDIYKKIEEQALYVWNKKTKENHFYSGGCTITCFPIYYSVQSKKLSEWGMQSLYEHFVKNVQLNGSPTDLPDSSF